MTDLMTVIEQALTDLAIRDVFYYWHWRCLKWVARR